MEGRIVSRRQWSIRIGVGVVLLLAGSGVWAVMNATALKAHYAARQLRTATSDDARSLAADKLAGLGDHGLGRLVEFVRVGDEPSRGAAAAAIERRLATLPDADPWAAIAAERLLGAAAGCEPSGQYAILERVPGLLQRTGGSQAPRCREAVVIAMKSPDARVRVLAVRLALHPEVRMRTEVVPMLADPEAEVRCAALVAVASATGGEPLVADEDLFHWLHDPDESVRKVCRDVLVSRDRTEREIALGTRLTNPEAPERLKLLLDLRFDDDLADPEPWLERLSRDIEPAIRAGAARVAVEVTGDKRLSCPAWVGRVADSDPDPTVRRVASYFRSVPLRTASGELRGVGGP